MTEPETVLVPALVGLSVTEAHELAFTARLVLTGPVPGEPLPTTGIVTAQEPGAGTRVQPAGTVAVRVDPGGRAAATAAPVPHDPAGTKPVS